MAKDESYVVDLEDEGEPIKQFPNAAGELTDSVPPEDKYKIVLILCTMLGVSSLFAWNTIITANNFWTYIFGPNSNFEFYLSAAFNTPQFIVLLLVAVFGPKVSFQIRIISTLAIICAMLILMPLTCSITAMSTELRGAIVLLFDFIAGTAQATLFGTIIGLTSIFPPRYTTSAMSGMGIGGVTIGVLAMICQALFENLKNGPVVTAWVYFILAVIILWVTLCLYVYTLRLPFTKYYLARYYHEINAKKMSFEPRGFNFYVTILKKIWVEALCIFTTFFITLSLFPGMLLQVPLVYTPSVWYNLIIPLEFNIFDTIGRTAPYWVRIPSKWVPLPVFARSLFYPLFILCVLGILPDPEFWCYGFVIFFGVTNGFLGTMSMMYAPQRVEKDEQEVAGISMSFFLNFGIFLASNFAILLNWMVEEIDKAISSS